MHSQRFRVGDVCPHAEESEQDQPHAVGQGEELLAAGHPLESEVQLLVVHGILHLLGHDHADAAEKARMWKAQAEILESLGLGQIQIREE